MFLAETCILQEYFWFCGKNDIRAPIWKYPNSMTESAAVKFLSNSSPHLKPKTDSLILNIVEQNNLTSQRKVLTSRHHYLYETFTMVAYLCQYMLDNYRQQLKRSECWLYIVLSRPLFINLFLPTCGNLSASQKIMRSSKKLRRIVSYQIDKCMAVRGIHMLYKHIVCPSQIFVSTCKIFMLTCLLSMSTCQII